MALWSCNPLGAWRLYFIMGANRLNVPLPPSFGILHFRNVLRISCDFTPWFRFASFLFHIIPLIIFLKLLFCFISRLDVYLRFLARGWEATGNSIPKSCWGRRECWCLFPFPRCVFFFLFSFLFFCLGEKGGNEKNHFEGIYANPTKKLAELIPSTKGSKKSRDCWGIIFGEEGKEQHNEDFFFSNSVVSCIQWFSGRVKSRGVLSRSIPCNTRNLEFCTLTFWGSRGW